MSASEDSAAAAALAFKYICEGMVHLGELLFDHFLTALDVLAEAVILSFLLD